MKKINKKDLSIIPVIQGLSAEGRSQSDIGMILGFAGKDRKGWFKRLRKSFPEIDRAWQAGKNAADTQLVITAFQRATGYEFVEEEVEYATKGVFGPNGLEVIKEVPVGRKIKTKHQPPDVTMLKLLLFNRLPEYFIDIKHIDLTNKSKLIKSDVRDEIASFAGKLLDAVEAVETGFEPKQDNKSEGILPDNS